MTRKLKNVELAIPKEMQEAILDLLVIREGVPPTPVRDLLSQASAALDEVNRTIQESVLAKMAAELVVRENRKRGTPQLSMDLHGNATLVVTTSSSYTTSSETIDPNTNGVGKLPSLTKLREKAQEMGVDISDLGRAKIKILKRLEIAEEAVG